MLALGIDPLAFLNEKDAFMRGMYLNLAEEAFKVRQRMDQNLAQEIANAVMKGLNG